MAPSADRLLAVIELQNAIAATGLVGDDVMTLVCERAAQVTGADAAAVLLTEGAELAIRAAFPRAAPGGRVTRAAMGYKTDDALGVPLLYGESAVGILEVTAKQARAFTDDDADTLKLLAQIVAIALHRAYTFPRPPQDTLHDPLTGFGNRRAFDERLQAELTRDKRYGHSFSLALLDLAGLEAAVDRQGQVAGDDALREVSRVLKKHTRAIDACFRIGPDDFALVMPGTSLEGAKVVADRCRSHIEDAKLLGGAIRPAFGAVEAQQEAAEDLMERARVAMKASAA